MAIVKMPLLVVTAILLALSMMLIPSPVHAAAATEQVTISQGNGYVSLDSATVTGTGCSVATIPMDGTQQTFTCDPSTSITITVPTDGSNTRYRAPGEATTILSYTTAGSGGTDTKSATVYFELQNTYQASTNGQGPPTWDSGLSAPVRGEQSGTASATLCTVSPTSGGTTTASCQGWGDYNVAVSEPSAMSGSGADIRWMASGTRTWTDTTGGNTHLVAYYKQLDNTFQWSLTVGTTPAGVSWAPTGYSLGSASSTICTQSPAAGSTSGSCLGWSDYNKAVTAPQFFGGTATNTQIQNAAGASSAACTPTTGGNSCTAVAYYLQYGPTVKYSAVSGSPSGNALVLTYKYLGTTTTYTLTTTAIQKYMDASAYSVGDTYVSSTERYSQNQNGTLGSSSAIVFSVYHQYKLSATGGSGVTLALKRYGVSASVTAPNWADSGTTATASSSGVWARSSGTGQRVASWNVDSGSATNVATTGTVTTTSITMSATHTVHFNAVTQYQLSLNAGAITVLSSVTNPTITGDKYWYDSGTAVSLVLNGIGTRSGGTGTRLASYSINGGTVVTVATTGTVSLLSSLQLSSAESVVANVVTQYQVTLDAGAAAALSSITAPPISGDAYWYDSGTNVNYVGNGVYGRALGAGTRVTGFSIDSGASSGVLTNSTFSKTVGMNSPHVLHVQTVKQYEVAFSGVFGVANATLPTIPGDNYWYDSGTNVSLSISGVFSRSAGEGQRTTGYSVDNGSQVLVATTGSIPVLKEVVLNAPVTVEVTAVRQYQVTLDAVAAQALGSITPPTLTGDKYWYDSGTNVTVTLNGVWGRNGTAGQRLSSYSVNGGSATPVATTGIVTALQTGSLGSPQSISGVAKTQYFLRVTGGGGATFNPKPPIPADAPWFDSGTLVSVSTNATFGSDGGTRQRVTGWSLDGGATSPAGEGAVVTTSSFVMSGPHAVNFDSVAQYHVVVAVKDASGVHAIAPSSVLVVVNGAAQNVVGGAIWVDTGSSIVVENVFWGGLDVTPSQPVQALVSAPSTLSVDARVYDAKVSVKDSFGIPVGGASVSIRLANGTTLQASTEGDGTVDFGLIPLGTYSGTVSNLGLSTSFSGNAATQNMAEVGVGLSYPVVGVVAAVIAAVVVVAVFLLRRGRAPARPSE